MVYTKLVKNRRSLLQLVAFGVAVIALLFSGSQAIPHPTKADVNEAVCSWELPRVAEVIDGDTIKVKNENTNAVATVRLIGVDTPETKDPRKPVQYYGKEASNYTKDQLEGKKVILEGDVEGRDKYSRALCYVRLADGTLFNEQLVTEGYARVDTFPPNIKYKQLFEKAEADAKQNNRGLWK